MTNHKHDLPIRITRRCPNCTQEEVYIPGSEVAEVLANQVAQTGALQQIQQLCERIALLEFKLEYAQKALNTVSSDDYPATIEETEYQEWLAIEDKLASFKK